MAIYVVFDKGADGDGYSQGFTTLTGLSEYVQIPYNTLVTHFTRKRKVWHYYPDKRILVIRVGTIHKGRSGVVGGFKTRLKGGHDRNI